MHKIVTATALLLCAALGTPAAAATKTYDVERIHIDIVDGEFNGKALLFLEDVSGVRSSIELLMVALVNNERVVTVHDCQARSPATPARDFNIVQVGPFAQQATANTTPMASTIASQCGPIGVTVSCPYEGVPAPQARNHVTVNHAGTYKGANGVASSYKITGHRDVVGICDVTINGGTLDGTATLTRLSQSHTGDTRFVDFYRDPAGWLNLRDVTFAF
jgi:hypothetical protein